MNASTARASTASRSDGRSATRGCASRRRTRRAPEPEQQGRR
jgi:hypothetical protein